MTAACAVMAALMWGKKTLDEVAEETGLCDNSVRYSLLALREHGLVYRHSVNEDKHMREDGGRKAGLPPVYWAANKLPFENVDQCGPRGQKVNHGCTASSPARHGSDQHRHHRVVHG